MNQLKAGAILSYVSLGLSNIVGLIYTPFMLQKLGESEYGLYALVASVVTYLTVLDFGFGNAIVRYTAKFRAEEKVEEQYAMFGMFILLYSGIGVIAFIAGLGLYFNVDSLFGKTMTPEEIDKAQQMMLLLVFNVAVTFPLSIFGSIITAYENFIFQKVINIIRTILNPIAIVIMLLMGYKAVGMVVITTVFNLITLFINWWYCTYRLKIKIVYNQNDWCLLKNIALFSVNVGLFYMIDKFYLTYGQFYLGVACGTIAISLFAVILQLRGYFVNLSWALTGVLLPKFTSLMVEDNRKAISDYFLKISFFQGVMAYLLLSVFYIFGASFIDLWIGETYKDVYLGSLILLTPIAVVSTQTAVHPIFQALNLQKYQNVIYVLVLILVVSLSYILIPRYAHLGASAALAIATFVGEILLASFIYSRILKLQMLRYWSIQLLLIGLNGLIYLFASFIFGFKVECHSLWEFSYKLLLYLLFYATTAGFVLFFIYKNIFMKKRYLKLDK